MSFTITSRRYLFLCPSFLAVISIARFYPLSSLYSLISLSPKNTERKSELLTLSDGIWPKVDDTDDRVDLQIKLGYSLANYLHKNNKTESLGKKIILVSDKHLLWEEFIAGDTVFRNNCPISNCFLTRDIARYKRTADAIILSYLGKAFVKQFYPKPDKQVIMFVTNVSDFWWQCT